MDPLQELLLRLDVADLPRSEEIWTGIRARVVQITKLMLRGSLERELEEEVTQEILLRLQEPEVRKQVARVGEAYVGRMARNLANDLHRALRRGRRAEEENLQERKVAPVGGSLEEVLALRHLVAQLDAGDRELLRRRFWLGQTIGEIASALGLPYNTCTSRIFRAIGRLKELAAKGGK